MPSIRLPLCLSLLLPALLGCSSKESDSGSAEPSLPTAVVTVGGRRLRVECAVTRIARENGLRYRSSLAADQGMLFCWAEDAQRAFPTKETVLSLSVAFCSAGGEILEIRSCRPCDSIGPTSSKPFRYALAVSDGWFGEHDVRAGAKAEWGADVTSLKPDPEGALRIQIHVGGHLVQAEVVYTDQPRQNGLMRRERLDAEAGMLFVYAKEKNLSFWMKDTSIPLAIAFFGNDGLIDEIKTMKPFDLNHSVAREQARFALEMNADWFTRHKVEPGARVILPKQVLDLPAEP